MNATTVDPEEVDPIARLKAVDPLSRRATSFESSLDRELLFQQITTDRTKNGKPGSSFDWKPRLAISVIAVGLILATVSATVLLTGSSTSGAAAAVVAAAEPTLGQNSGRIDVDIEVRTGPSSGAPLGRSFASYRYEGEDFSATYISEHPEADFPSITLTQIGNRFFLAGALPDGLVVESPTDETDWDVDFDSIVGASRNRTSGNAMMPMVEAMDDLVEVASKDGVTTYEGMMPSSILAEADPETLPPGLALFAGTAPYGPTGIVLFDHLPESLAVEFTVTNDTLTRLVVTVSGDTAEGPIDATVTTDYQGFGEPQGIEAPGSELIVTPEEFEQLFEE